MSELDFGFSPDLQIEQAEPTSDSEEVGSSTKRRGRPKGSKNKSTKTNRIDKIRVDVEKAIADAGKPLMLLSPTAAVIWQQEIEANTNLCLKYAAKNDKFLQWLETGGDILSIVGLVMFLASIAYAIASDRGMIDPGGRIPQMLGVTAVYAEIHEVGADEGTTNNQGYSPSLLRRVPEGA